MAKGDDDRELAQPGGGAETAEQVAEKAKAEAEAKAAAAHVEADAADELIDLAGTPPAPLNRPETDVIGRKLDWDHPDAARAQQREAQAIRQKRVEIDVARVNRGLAPKYATK